jgi:V/A-type H+-transporting ATPase subunit E
MSKEAILERIISDAQAAADATVAEAEGRAAEIIAEAEARAARDRQGTSAIIAERSKAIADGKAAAARLDAAKVMLAAKRGVIDAVYARALEKLKALPQKDAVRLAEGLLLSYAEDGDELVFATNFAYKAQVLKLAVVAEKNLKNSGKTADIDGGFILIGKNSDKDLSYGALLALDREERQAEIAAKLFSDGVSNNA